MRTVKSQYDKKKVKFFESEEDAYKCYLMRYKMGYVDSKDFHLTKMMWKDKGRLPNDLEDSEIVYKCPTNTLDNFLT